jgi:phosphonate degradation associated HDIG domain protein
MVIDEAIPVSHSRCVVSEIVAMFTLRGRDAYYGESVTQLEHALQCAYLALHADAPDSLVGAALLHDLGHLLPGSDENKAAGGVDGCHESLGARWLENYFLSSVTEPIGLHVLAKRYLCATDQTYLNNLSKASRMSLLLQGGPLARREICYFESYPYFFDAVQLRRWDDEAKNVGLSVPPFSTYLPLLHTLANRYYDKYALCGN